ncbi:LysE family translocator (plasmid) [Ralstonia sp. 25C]|uniref:LysE family translocator n=1 Tax=Ralstonia sp. 25C TaxID=3447363 RepID=UPI003F750170
MTTQMILAAWLSAFLICSTPGPNMLHVLTRCVHFGVRQSLPAMAGCITGLMLILTASAAGLGALMRASTGYFELVRYVGVSYLVYLGVQAWRSKDLASESTQRATIENVSRMFWRACMIGLTNPKLMLFGVAFMPQFVDAHSEPVSQYAMIILGFVLSELFWYCVYGVGSGHVRQLLGNPRLRRQFNRLTGSIFILFGGLLLGTKS